MIYRLPHRRRRSPLLPRTTPVRYCLSLLPSPSLPPPLPASTHPALINSKTTLPPGDRFGIIPGENAFEGGVCGFS